LTSSLFINNNVYSHREFWCMHGPPKENYVPTLCVIDGYLYSRVYGI